MNNLADGHATMRAYRATRQEVEGMGLDDNDIRVHAPILTYRDTAAIVRMPEPTVRAWSQSRDNFVHSRKPRKRGFPAIPLVGLAEVSSLRALRQGGMTMSEVRRAVEYIRRESGDRFALTNPRLMTDGATAFVQHDEGVRRIRDGQDAFVEVIQEHLKPINMGPDNQIESYSIGSSGRITIDPRFNSGRPAFHSARIPVFAVLGALRAGESPWSVADDFGIDLADVESVQAHREYFALFA